MSDYRDPLEDDLSEPERNELDRKERVRQIIADTREQLRETKS